MTQERARIWLDRWQHSQGDPEANQVLLDAFREFLTEIASDN